MPLQFARSQRIEFTRSPRVTFRQRGERAALDHQHLGVGDCLGRKRMFGREFEPEYVTGHIEAADLAAAIAENLVGPYRAADDLVEVLGRLILTENLGVARKRHGGAHERYLLRARFAIECALQRCTCRRRHRRTGERRMTSLWSAVAGSMGPLPPGEFASYG